MSWTEERTALLRKLWAEGLSGSQIAKQLGGCTRCAVIGKVHRLGLAYRLSAPRPPVRANKRTRRNIKPRAYVPPPSTPATLSSILAQIAALDPIDETVSLTSIEPGRCRYIKGDPKEGAPPCGRPTIKGGPWCEEHRKLVYVPTKKREAKPDSARRQQLRELERREAFQMGVAV